MREIGAIDLGEEWGIVVRELAGWDPTRIPAVLAWPMREALIAFRERVRREARDEHRFRVLEWAGLRMRGTKRPEVPAIVKAW